MSGNSKQDWLHRLVVGRVLRLPTVFWMVLVIAVSVGAIVEGCGNGSSSSPGTGMATVSIKVSDPATCMAPNGPYSHVYVTISDVKVHVSATAADNDPGWVDLTPNLAKAPMQIDLLSLPSGNCFLASLGDSLQLQPGNYQQLRVILTDSTALLGGTNKCTTSANCVVVSGNTSPLQLSSETQTGIKIPSGQIANGGFNIAAGQTKDLDIDFNTCVSIVQEGNGSYRLKPVLHASEVSTTSTSINGTVIDSATSNHITGTAMVALEQRDALGVDRVVMSTLTDSGGNFVFCPLPTATYDVVVVGLSGAGVVYSPTVVTGVTTGSAMGSVPLHALPVVSVSAATLQGMVTSQNTASPAAGTMVDVQLSTLEAVSSTLTVTVPLLPTASQSSAVLALETAPGGGCPTSTDCVSYSIKVSAGAAFVGAFTVGGTTVTQSALPAAYLMDGIATVPSSGGTLDCSPSDVTSASVTPVPAIVTAAPTLKFTGCS
jgi:Domain of unknown function (DUF4382)